jgi:hypothetical protein
MLIPTGVLFLNAEVIIKQADGEYLVLVLGWI